MIRGSGTITAPSVLSRPEHQAAYWLGNCNFPSAENQEAESSVGSVPRKKSSSTFPVLKRDGSSPVATQISQRARFALGGTTGRSLLSHSSMTAAQSGAAERTASVSRIGRPSKFPAQTATVRSLSKPTVHASRKPLLVPFFAATRSSNASGELKPKLFRRASLSHKISVMISAASVDTRRVIG